MKKTAILTGIALIASSGMILATSQTSSAAGRYGETNTVQDKVELAREKFKNLNDSDKVLRVDGGYLHGEMESADASGNKTYYNSKTDPNSITVAEARKIEMSIAQSTTSILSDSLRDKNPRFVNPPTQSKGLTPGSEYQSGAFNGGAGWEFAGYKFFNLSGASTITWWTYGDVARAGDMLDAHNQYNDPYGTYGIQLNPGVAQGVYPTDGGMYTTYYSWKPASGSYYRVRGQ